MERMFLKDGSVMPIVTKVSKSRTSTVRISSGKVVMSFAKGLTVKQKNDVRERFMKWARQRLEKVKISDFIPPEYVDGGRICTHNKIYELEVCLEKRSRAKCVIQDNALKVFLSSEIEPEKLYSKVKDLAEKVVMKDQLPYLKEVLAEINKLYFQEEYNEVRFKRVNSRFGSCSSKRNINIAYRLLFAPRNVFRYVCVHELAHLKEFNHSKRFWDLVEDAMPEYKEAESWLKNNGFMLG